MRDNLLRYTSLVFVVAGLTTGPASHTVAAELAGDSLIRTPTAADDAPRLVRGARLGESVDPSRMSSAPEGGSALSEDVSDRPKSLTTQFAESFEGSWPAAPWRVYHADGAADVEWGRSNHRASLGAHSIWCADSGPQAPPPGGTVPPDTTSWVVAGPFDLSAAESGELHFDLWLRTEQFHDLFMWLVSTDGETFSGRATSSNTDGWEEVWVDLTDWGSAGDVTGQPLVWIAFVYQSDHSEGYEGAYIDNVVLAADDGTVVGQGYTYTTDVDFELGTAVGLQGGEDSLELSREWNALPYLWVPNSNEGTVSKLDIETASELGRYRTGPQRDLEPSGVAVDLYGDCWIGNRGAGTVVKIGLEEGGGCVDRDGSGAVDTSRDADGDGSISDAEVLDWGEDECALYEVVLVEDAEDTYIPGETHDSYLRNNVQALAIDADNDVWVGVADSGLFYRVNGGSGDVEESVILTEDGDTPFAAVVDRFGTLWTSVWPDDLVVRIDPGRTGVEMTTIDLEHGSRRLALDGDNRLFVTGYEDAALSLVDMESHDVEGPFPVDWRSDGVAATSDGHVWIAAPDLATVRRYNTDLFNTVTLPVGIFPTAVAVDGMGKVWAMGADSTAIVRIDPTRNLVDIQKQLGTASGHDAVGDLTGAIVRSVTSSFGTWTVVHDGFAADTEWGTISWSAVQPVGTSITARVRSSNEEESWSSWEWASNGLGLVTTPAGRYLQVEVALQLETASEPPILEELTVEPAVVEPGLEAAFGWTPDTPTVSEQVLFTDQSTGEPNSWQWTFGDDASSTEQNPVHTYGEAGSFWVELTVGDGDDTDIVSRSLTVSSVVGCGLACTASVPTMGTVGEAVLFEASATPTGCQGSVEYSWQFGDGGFSGVEEVLHVYNEAGTYSWQMTTAVDDVTCARSGAIAIGGDSPSCVQEYWVPVVSHVDGVHGSVWRSEVGLLGLRDAATAVELSFHGSDGRRSRSTTVAPNALLILPDVVDWIEPGGAGSGALQLCADGPLVVTSRTLNQLADDHACLPGGTFGQYVEGSAGGSGLPHGQVGVLSQLRENERFRTNIGYANSSTGQATFTVALYDHDGVELAVYTVTLAAGEWKQANRPFFEIAGRTDVDSGWAKIQVTEGTGVIAYASVIDNVTNDPTTLPLSR